MKKSLTTIFWSLFSFFLWAQTYTTTATLNLRDAASSNGKILITIPQTTKLQSVEEANGWCKVSYGNKTGYVSKKYLQLISDNTSERKPKPTETHATEPIRHYTNVNGNEVQSPTHYDNGPPPGATAQCNDGSYSFSQHRRGTCSHHSGVKRWLP